MCAVCCWVSAVVPKATHAHSELTSWQGRGSPGSLQDQPRLPPSSLGEAPPPFPCFFSSSSFFLNHHFQPWPIARPLAPIPFPGQPSQVAQSLGPASLWQAQVPCPLHARPPSMQLSSGAWLGIPRVPWRALDQPLLDLPPSPN